MWRDEEEIVHVGDAELQVNATGRVMIRRSDGVLVRPGPLPPGQYKVIVTGSDNEEEVVKLKLKAGQRWLVECNDRGCKAKRQ